MAREDDITREKVGQERRTVKTIACLHHLRGVGQKAISAMCMTVVGFRKSPITISDQWRSSLAWAETVGWAWLLTSLCHKKVGENIPLWSFDFSSVYTT